jgi:predicted amidohydrolase
VATEQHGQLLRPAHVRALIALVAGLLFGAPGHGAPFVPSYDRLPRKVLIGTVVGGVPIYSRPLEERLQRIDAIVGEMAGQAKSQFPGKRLDLVVIPEYFVARPGEELLQKVVRLGEVEPSLAACASKYGCYLVAPMLLREEGEPQRFSNAAFLFDRTGHVAGVYRKVHPVGGHGSEVLEGGLTPGYDFPVFDCDFGKLGIQICFDMLYPDGWRALADKGAEIVALPSASSETIRPSMYALQNGYYIVSATPWHHAAIFSPVGTIEAEATREGEVLVHEIDLSYEILHWDADLDDGAAVSRRFGDKAGFHYYEDQDIGIYWSNDPTRTIGQMMATFGVLPVNLEVERLRGVQDRLRGAPIK